MHVGFAFRVERQLRRLGTIEEAGIQRGIGVDPYRPLGAIP